MLTQRRDFQHLDHYTPQADLDTLRKLVDSLLSNQGMGVVCSDPGARSEGAAHQPFPGPLGPSLTIVEVGSWTGLSTLALARAGTRVYCVDTWQGNPADRLGQIASHYGSDHIFRTFCRNMGERLLHTVFPCRGESLVWASVWPGPVDLIYIDADHRYECVKADIQAWYPQLRPGGILCGHDYGVFDGVTRAVDEFGFTAIRGNIWIRKRIQNIEP